jgi:hypothetical protein
LLPSSRSVKNAAANAGYWTAPSILAVILYWPGLVAWFQKDDFAWLKLLQIARQSQGFRWALFAPLAQGTIRTLSERAFFLSFFALFGMNPLPYRCWALLTFAAGLMLIASLCTKLTGSRAAGFWAAVIWTVNSSMGVVMSWTSIYYEILCAVFLMASLWLLVRYAETGEVRFYAAQWITFLIGFGVLELNVVYPALAAAFALCRARRILGKVWPMFLASAAYTAIHRAAVPFPAEGVYKLHWDSSIFSTLWTYWKWTLGPNRLIFLRIYPSHFRSILAIALMAGLVGFLLWEAWRREWITAFFASWYLIVLGPLLLLRDHMDDSYLTIPLVGFAMWGAWAFVCGWRAGALSRGIAILLLAIYVAVSIPVARVVTQSFYDRSRQIRSLVLGVVAETRGGKDKLILLKGVDSEMFWSALYHRPFPLYGIDEVYLLPENESEIVPPVPPREREQFYADPARVRGALKEGRAIALDVAGGEVRDITASTLEIK